MVGLGHDWMGVKCSHRIYRENFLWNRLLKIELVRKTETCVEESLGRVDSLGHGVKILRWKKNNSHKLKCYNKCISYIQTSWHIVDSSMFSLAPGQFVDHTSGSKFEVNLYLYEHLF